MASNPASKTTKSKAAKKVVSKSVRANRNAVEISILVPVMNEAGNIRPLIDEICTAFAGRHFEIIYIDNESSDASVNVAKAHGVKKIKTIKKYLPGLAINMGIEMSHGKYIVIVSAHCIPTNTEWLGSMVDSIKNKKVAGGIIKQMN